MQTSSTPRDLPAEPAWQHFRGQPITRPRFVRRWHYRLDRHPIMSGMLVGLWAQPTMTTGHLLLAGALTTYILIGVSIQERDLLPKHRQDYRNSRAEVRSLVPTLPFRG